MQAGSGESESQWAVGKQGDKREKSRKEMGSQKPTVPGLSWPSFFQVPARLDPA